MALKLSTFLQERYLIPLKIILVYVAWKGFHYLTTLQGTSLHLLWENAMFQIGSWYAAVTSLLLIPFVEHTYAKGISIFLHYLNNDKIVLVEEHCLAIPGMVIFTGTVVFFKGSRKDKAWFIPLGITGIILINLLRLFFVSLAWLYLTPYFFQMHHSLVYVVITYGFIFLMLAWWMNRVRK